MLDPDVRRVLVGASIAHLATVLPDGSPHTTPVYVGAHGDYIVFFTGPGTRKARNLPRNTPARPIPEDKSASWPSSSPNGWPSASAENGSSASRSLADVKGPLGCSCRRRPGGVLSSRSPRGYVLAASLVRKAGTRPAPKA
jgi:hypothetical protein